MGKILHLIPDEKVTDNVIENFENVFNHNIFYVLGNDNERTYCRIKKKNVVFGEADFFSKENVNKDVIAVVIHGLNYIFAKLVLQLEPKIKVAWFAWGFDIYNLPKIIDKLYAPKSIAYLKKNNPKFDIINTIKKNKILRTVYYNYINKTDDFYTVYEKAYKRIDFLCTYIREDYDLFTRFYPNSIEYQEIGYFSINQYLAGRSDLRITAKAKNILIGNSNSLENNHLDVFEVLKKCDLQGKVVVPLSYGNDQKYKAAVLNRGSKVLGKRFYPLLDFMDREKYLKLLSDCSVAIFYHYRQQAMGNILALLYMGARVYLSKQNPVYHYLKRNGIIVFSFDDEFSMYSNTVLEKEEQKLNRDVLDIMFSNSALERQYSDLINKLINVDR